MSDWRYRAACRDVDPEIFYPVANRDTKAHAVEVFRAKQVCRQCPVQTECLNWAMNFLPEGIAGGETEDERRLLRRRLGLPALSSVTAADEAWTAERGRQLLRAGRSTAQIMATLGVAERMVTRWRRELREAAERAS